MRSLMKKKTGQLQDLSNTLSHGLSKFSTQLVSHPWTDELRQFYRAHSSDTNAVKTPTSGREANWMLQIQLFLFFLMKHTQICHIVKRHEWLAQRTLTARWEGSRGREIKSQPGRRWSSNRANFPVLYVYLILSLRGGICQFESYCNVYVYKLIIYLLWTKHTHTHKKIKIKTIYPNTLRYIFIESM